MCFHQFALVAIVALASGIPAQTQKPDDSIARVQVRFHGDVVVPAESREDFVLVVGGDARIEGEVGTLVVAKGTARLAGGRVENLAVVRGTAFLSEGAVVSRDVHLVESEIEIAPGAGVEGRIDRGYAGEALHAMWLVAAVIAFGLAVATVVAGLLAAAVAAKPVRRAGAMLTARPGPTLLAGIVVWVALPIAAGLFMATVIGIPTSLGVLVFVLPTLGFIGYLVSAIRLGDWVIERIRGRPEASHPYLAAVVGLAILIMAGWMPLIGGLITLLAALGGGAAVALLAWTAARAEEAGPSGPPAEASRPAEPVAA